MKRVISCLLTVALLLTLVMPVAMAADERTSGAFTYRIKGNGTAAITGYDWKEMKGEDIYIPRMLDGYPVTEIADGAFAAELDYDYFGRIRSFPEYGITQAGSLVIPETIVSIGAQAFMGVSFQNKNITIPDSVQHIGYGAFSTLFGVQQFSVSPNHPVFATIDGILYNKKQKELLAIPGDYKYNKRIVIPEGIKSIGDYACFQLEWRFGVPVQFPSSLEKLGKYSFAYSEIETTKLVEKVIDLSHTQIKEIPEGCFLYEEKYHDPTEVLLPSELISIGKWAFYHGGYHMSFPDTLKIIEYEAFADGGIVQSKISFPDTSSLTTIGSAAFRDCKLNEVILPDGLETIGDRAFFKNFTLRRLVIPSSVTCISGTELCNRETVTLEVVEYSYSAMWAEENGYTIQRNESEDTSWLND